MEDVLPSRKRGSEEARLPEDPVLEHTMTMTMTMTMTHSEKSHIHRMKAWPYRQECRGHDPTKKNLFCWYSLLVGKVRRYKLLEDRL